MEPSFKYFRALNVYDLFRARLFSVTPDVPSASSEPPSSNKGVFHTSNFLLDSPSMVLTGEGRIDLNKNEVNGVIHVSPLIVLDRTIYKIPILRNIIKQEERGFLYL